MSGFEELHDELREVARDVLAGDPDADTIRKTATELGWLSLELPGSVGGSEATFAETAVVLEELGRAAAAGPFLSSAVLAPATALAVAPNDSRDEFLSRLAEGSTLAAVALAPNGDSPEASPAFTLESGRLSGRAVHVVEAPGADKLLVLARADDSDPVVVLVDRSEVTVTTQPVLDASREFGTVEATDVPVEPGNVWTFTADGERSAQRVLDRGAIALAIDAMGVASAMLELTVGYVGDRKQFDRPIGSFQAVKHQCADVLADLRIGRELLDAAIAAVVNESGDTDLAAARAKSFMTAAAVDAVGKAMQLHGGIGYTWESGIHRYMKRAVMDRSLFGSPAEHRMRIGSRLRR
jgi:alkylation response protein AidB-like acyl-CoA dehydrogenase